MALVLKSKPWADISGFYKRLAEQNAFFLPMLQVVQQLAPPGYAVGLFPATSHTDLLLGQTDEMEMGREMIGIAILQDGRISVEVQEQPSPLYKTWSRVTSSDKAFEVVEKALLLKKWFAKM